MVALFVHGTFWFGLRTLSFKCCDISNQEICNAKNQSVWSKTGSLMFKELIYIFEEPKLWNTHNYLTIHVVLKAQIEIERIKRRG